MEKVDVKILMEESFFKAGEYACAIQEYYEAIKKSGKNLIEADLEKFQELKDGWNKEMENYMEAAKKFFDL